MNHIPKFVGHDVDNARMEIMELDNHPYYVAVQVIIFCLFIMTLHLQPLVPTLSTSPGQAPGTLPTIPGADPGQCGQAAQFPVSWLPVSHP